MKGDSLSTSRITLITRSLNASLNPERKFHKQASNTLHLTIEITIINVTCLPLVSAPIYKGITQICWLSVNTAHTQSHPQAHTHAQVQYILLESFMFVLTCFWDFTYRNATDKFLLTSCWSVNWICQWQGEKFGFSFPFLSNLKMVNSIARQHCTRYFNKCFVLLSPVLGDKLRHYRKYI